MQLTSRELATIRAALAMWLEDPSRGRGWVRFEQDVEKHRPLSRREVDDLQARLQRAAEAISASVEVAEFRWRVPTYWGRRNAAMNDPQSRPDFGPPYQPVSISKADGIKVELGACDNEDRGPPDIQIERRPKGWAVFIHTSPGDPAGYVFILDDMQTFVLPEGFPGTPTLEVVKNPPRCLDDIR